MVWSRPRPTLRPGFTLVPRWRTMMLPATTASPPNFLTPRRRPAVSRPLRDEPPAFLCAMVQLLFLVGLGRSLLGCGLGSLFGGRLFSLGLLSGLLGGGFGRCLGLGGCLFRRFFRRRLYFRLGRRCLFRCLGHRLGGWRLGDRNNTVCGELCGVPGLQ